MAGKERRRLFEELGLLGDAPEPSNPYKTLGVDPEFAGNLLREDPTGETLRLATNALRQALARRFHPDVPKTGDAERFREIDEAYRRIDDAVQSKQSSTLNRWSKAGPVTQSSPQIEKLRTQRESLVGHATELFRTNLELGHHPEHFSQLQWAQGVLLQRGNTPLLLQQLPEGGVQIASGRRLNIGEKYAMGDTQAFDFPVFLRQYELFGLEPGSKIAAYIDQDRRASILAPDLTFLMDITTPVTEYLKQRKTTQKGLPNDPKFWARSRSPILFTTSVPTSTQRNIPPTQIISFYDIGNSVRNATWELPLEVAGTISDQTFFNRIRHTKASGATAITGSTPSGWQRFNLISTPASKFIEDNPGYSPLITNGNSLIFYDKSNSMPVITDTKVIGMIGRESQAA